MLFSLGGLTALACPDVCPSRAWWGLLTPASCTPWSKFATLSEVDFFLNTACLSRGWFRVGDHTPEPGDVWMARCQSSSWWPLYPYSTKQSKLFFLVTSALTGKTLPGRHKAVAKERGGRHCQLQLSALCSWGGCEGRKAMLCHGRDAFPGCFSSPTNAPLFCAPSLGSQARLCKWNMWRQLTNRGETAHTNVRTLRTTEPTLVAQTRVINAEVMLQELFAACSHPALYVQAKQVTESPCKFINQGFPLSCKHTPKSKLRKPNQTFPKTIRKMGKQKSEPPDQSNYAIFSRLFMIIKSWQYRQDASCFYSVCYL